MTNELGTLVVVVLKARNLRDKHTIHKQDVYTQASISSDIKKTAVDVRGGQHPVWDEELRFPISKEASDKTRKLEVCCYSKEPRQDDLVGRGSVDITETLGTGEFDEWVPLQTEDGAYRGELFLEMTFYAAAPPPLQRRASKWNPKDRLKRPTTAYDYNSAPPLPGAPKGSSPSAHKDALPPLPEESTPIAAAPPAIPAFLRPGGGATSPKSSVSRLPTEPPAQGTPASRDTSPARVLANASQAPVDSIPAHLRPGGGVARPPQQRTHGRTSSQVSIPEPHIPTPEVPQYGSPPSSYPPSPLPEHGRSQPAYPYGGASPPRAAHPEYPYNISTYPQVPQPDYTHSTPSYPQPYGAPPSVPRQSLSSSTFTPSYPYNTPASQPEYPYSATSPAPTHFHPPQPQVQPYPPTNSYSGYPPPNTHSSYPPASAPLSYAPPKGAADGRQALELPDPYLEKRYQSPLPLPRDAASPPPPPKHPEADAKAKAKAKAKAEAEARAKAEAEARAKAEAEAKAKEDSERRMRAEVERCAREAREKEERDRAVALALEQQEEAQRRALREQEEADAEIARKLDLELNLS